MHLQPALENVAKYTEKLGSVGPRICLHGPSGTELYQEQLVKGLAKELGANMILFDSSSLGLEGEDEEQE